MKRYLFILLAALFLGNNSYAAVGDTTWVQANVDSLSWYGNYDTTITFPAAGTTYRRIYMIFTLGKYMCPGYTYGTGSVPWCGDWDYTVMNYLMTPGGDTLELGRFITPYANNGAPRTPWAWQQHYVYDVTDYAALLHGSNTIRILYSGYSGGFTADIKFAFIEGTPDRDVAGIKRLWHGSYNYGTTPAINTYFPSVAETAPAGTISADLKFTVTGHGSDTINQCCEFMSHNYQVMLNSSSVATNTIWRNDCGSNQLSPQSGTWLYERANWCPGALVNSNVTSLPSIAAGSNFNIGIVFDPYTAIPSSDGFGSYTTDAAIIYYKGMNKNLDASIDQIIAPTSDENHFRENPISMSPVLRIKNTGATTITSVQVSCTVDGGAPFVYDWSGSLAPLAETEITLPLMPDVRSVSGTSGTHSFQARITMVNGATGDDDASNNVMSSSFVGAPQWPVSFKIQMRTNNESNGTGSSETTWQIFNESGGIVASRMTSALNTTYIDTVTLGPGSYKFVMTDGSCDGLQWWVHGAANDGISAGNLYIRKLTGQNIPLNGYSYSGTYANDFGCSFTQYFTTAWPEAVSDVSAGAMLLEAYPNPAMDMVNIAISGMPQVTGKISIIDMLGRVVSETACTNASSQLDVSALQNGVYTLVFADDMHPANKLTARLLVAR